MARKKESKKEEKKKPVDLPDKLCEYPDCGQMTGSKAALTRHYNDDHGGWRPGDEVKKDTDVIEAPKKEAPKKEKKEPVKEESISIDRPSDAPLPEHVLQESQSGKQYVYKIRHQFTHLYGGKKKILIQKG